MQQISHLFVPINENLSNVSSLGARSILFIHNLNLLNPSKCEIKNISSENGSIQDALNNYREDIFRLFDRIPKGKFTQYIHRPAAFFIRSTLSGIITGAIAPFGVLFNGTAATFYLLRFTTRKIYRLVDTAKVEEKKIESDWKKVSHFAKGFLGDAFLTFMSTMFLGSLTLGFAAEPLLIPLSLIFTLPYGFTEYLIESFARYENQAGLYKGFILRKEYGIADPFGNILPSTNADDEQIEKESLSGHFASLFQMLSLEVFKEIKKLAKVHRAIRNVHFNSILQSAKVSAAPLLISKTIENYLSFTQLKSKEIHEITKKLRHKCQVMADLGKILEDCLNFRANDTTRYVVVIPPYLSSPFSYSIIDDKLSDWKMDVENFKNQFQKRISEIPEFKDPVKELDYFIFKNAIFSNKSPRKILGKNRFEAVENYKKYSMVVHPDKLPARDTEKFKEESEELFKLLTKAYSYFKT